MKQPKPGVLLNRVHHRLKREPVHVPALSGKDCSIQHVVETETIGNRNPDVAVRFQDAADLLKRLHVIGEVFQGVIADDRIHGVRGQRDLIGKGADIVNAVSAAG